jgi:hypothetical protein
MNESWQIVYDVLKTILVILLVVVLGVAAVNQILIYKYHAELLQKPCELCANLNKPQTSCIADCFNIYTSDPAFKTLPNIQVNIE